MKNFKSLEERMRRAQIFEEDIDERFIRSMGQGGQNVNKVATCVQLTHRPTGLMVKCQQERSQAMNRLFARQLLLEKIVEQRRKIERAKIAQREKKKRQNYRRSEKSKEIMLQKKKKHSEKKQQRKKVQDD
ncbi:MAG: peptide chain release factor-like protein [Candidatus Omnitrophica bacterium]|nr:peptide chain release factor-like protein [Candidatus Omnitrophota bacterium]